MEGFSGKAGDNSKKIGLYFGSFNPIHIGHLIIANYISQLPELDEVWFIVSPENPLKKKNNLLPDHHRLAMVRIAIEDNPKLKANDIEFHLPKPSYTVYTLQALKEKYPDYVFSLIMGEDNLRTLHKWRNFEHILENYQLIIYPRIQTSNETEETSEDNGIIDHSNVKMTAAPVMNISASFIRKMIASNKEVRYLLSEPVFQYLDEMNFYK
ncbi:nicotinate (nicotinamide) nucleotide adenylyltransferase [Crocinitomix sp.]|nr:nicotinate (nicotinamide) nucleotide adenylyltransferase [Crocinitomix sp.]